MTRSARWRAGSRRAASLAGVTGAALLYTLACPPHEWSGAAWAVPGLLFVSTRRLRLVPAALSGALFAVLIGWGMTGWALNASLAYFAFNRLVAGAFVLGVWLLYGGIPYGLSVAGYGLAARRLPAACRAPFGAWVWVAGEALRTTLFTGMPWELLGHTQFRNLLVVQIADLGGVYAVSFLVALVSLSVAELVSEARASGRALLRHLGPSLALLAVVLAYGLWSEHAYRGVAGPTRTIAVVQANIPNAFRWKRAFSERTLTTYSMLTRATEPATPDLIVWPENAVDLYLDREPMLRAELGAVAGLAREGLLMGAPRLGSDGRAHNSAYLLGPDGGVVGTYDKQRLVPFAEYDPFGSPSSGAEPAAYAPGPTTGPLATATMRLGTVICYEALFPRLVRQLVRQGAELLVNISNDSWLDGGDGAAPRQHFSMVIFRAIETRRYLVRASASGVSGFVGPYGDPFALVPSNTAGTAVASVVPLHGTTPYVRWGDSWIAVAGLLLAATFLRPLGRSSR